MEPEVKPAAALTRELAPNELASVIRPAPNPNRVLIEEAGGRWGDYADLLREPQVHACLQVRKMALVGHPWSLVPASPGADKATGAWLTGLMERLDWPGLLGSLMDAIVLGFKVAEIIWTHEDGRWVPAEVKVRPNERFGFGTNGALHLADTTTRRMEPVMEQGKFLVATWGPRDGNRYGSGLGEMLYYLAWFKRENLKFWLIFNDKHAYPTPVAALPEGSSDTEMRRMRDELARLRDQSVIVHRQGTEIRYLEAERHSSVETFHDLIEFCNAEIAKVVLGQTLTTATPHGASTGSYALGRVHNSVREDIAAGDASWASALAGRLIGWILDLNEGPGAPRWKLEYEKPSAISGQLSAPNPEATQTIQQAGPSNSPS